MIIFQIKKTQLFANGRKNCSIQNAFITGKSGRV